MIKNIMKIQAFFDIAEFWNGFCFVLLLRKRLLHFLCYLGKRSSETLRSSRSQMFFKIGVFKNVSIFSKKHLCSSLFLIKLQAGRSAFLLKKTLRHRCFHVNIAKFFRTVFFQWNFLFITLF